MKKTIFPLLLTLFAVAGYAQESQTAYNFLRVPVSAHAAALGGAPGSPFLYDEENDLYTCPGGKALRLRNLNRSVGGLHWVYFADRSDCAACPLKEQCVGKGRAKRLERSYFWREIREDLRELDSPTYQRALRKRQIWSEFCSTEVGAQVGAAPAARTRGSGRPLPLVSDRIEPEADDQMDRVTP